MSDEVNEAAFEVLNRRLRLSPAQMARSRKALSRVLGDIMAAVNEMREDPEDYSEAEIEAALWCAAYSFGIEANNGDLSAAFASSALEIYQLRNQLNSEWSKS